MQLWDCRRARLFRIVWRCRRAWRRRRVFRCHADASGGKLSGAAGQLEFGMLKVCLGYAQVLVQPPPRQPSILGVANPRRVLGVESPGRVLVVS